MDNRICLVDNDPGIVSALQQEGVSFFHGSGINDAHSHVEGGGVAAGFRTGETYKELIYSGIYTKVYKKGLGCFIQIDKNLSRELTDYRSVIKEFITSAGTVRERVALISKKDAREELYGALAAAFYLRGLPFVRLWYYPASYRALFNFRFDLDEDTDSDLEAISKACADHKDCTTYFTCCASYEKNFHKIERLAKEGFDLQSHGYYHHTYSDKRQNDDNIDKSLAFFKRIDRPIEGFAAPKGIWNEGLQRSLEERSFLYSSEFSLSYDNFPFYPLVKGSFSETLQIPIHPICWGLYADAGIVNDEEIKKYMIDAVSRKYDYNLPAIIYGHPSERISKNTKLLEDIYERTTSLNGMWKVKLSDLARWWKKRNNIRFREFELDREGKALEYAVEDDTYFSGACLSIQTASGKRALCRIEAKKAQIELGGLAYEAFNDPRKMPDTYKASPWIMPHFKALKQYVANSLDWEKNTPVNELRRDSFQSNLKYFLRKYTERP